MKEDILEQFPILVHVWGPKLLMALLLLVYRPFSKTDYVAVKGMKGEVTAIDLRYTTLQHGGQKILLPNSLLFTNPITIGKPTDDE